jgi:hypothetical protein
MRLGLTRQAATGRRKARHDRSHPPGHGNGAAVPPADAPAREAEIELGPVEMSQPEPRPASRSLDDERRARAAGGPEDRAHYNCSCGYAFDANVSTSVACPHCGAGQAW